MTTHPEPRSPDEPLAEAVAAALRPWLGINDPAQLRQAVGRILAALSTELAARTPPIAETLAEWARLGIGPYAALAVTRPEPDLDAAWSEAEAALPNGWRISEMHWWPDEWHARAEPRPAYKTVLGPSGHRGTMWLGKGTVGPTPAAALLSLASTLRSTKPG